MAYFFYNISLMALFLAAAPFMPVLLLFGTRYRDGFAQRFAVYRNALGSALNSDPIWIHAASVGEVRATGALIRALKANTPDLPIIISTFTATGNRMAREAGEADKIIFLPLDFLWVVRRALRRLHPRLLIFVETEIWPNLLREAYRRGIPTVMLSGRLSEKAFSRYQLWRPFFRRVLEQYTAMGMQSAEDAARMLKLGAARNKVSVVGNLKFAADGVAKPCASSLFACPQRPIFVAGSSHRGEEEILLKALRLARSSCPKLSMVLAPRHPERFAEVERLLEQSDFTFQRKTRTRPEEYFEQDVLLLDTVGELEEFFQTADVAFVGGSLVDVGGHNVLEPARCQKPVLFGPYMDNFKNMAEQMKQNGAAVEVQDAGDLARVLTLLINDSQTRMRMGRSAAEFAGAQRQALARNLSLAKQYL